jgi:hypothetical protein
MNGSASMASWGGGAVMVALQLGHALVGILVQFVFEHGRDPRGFNGGAGGPRRLAASAQSWAFPSVEFQNLKHGYFTRMKQNWSRSESC